MDYASKLIFRMPTGMANRRLVQDIDQRIKFFQAGVISLSGIAATDNLDIFKSHVLEVVTKMFQEIKIQLKNIINKYIDYHIFIGKITGSIYQCMSAIDMLINKVKTDSSASIKRRINDIIIYMNQVILHFMKFKKTIAV